MTQPTAAEALLLRIRAQFIVEYDANAPHADLCYRLDGPGVTDWYRTKNAADDALAREAERRLPWLYTEQDPERLKRMREAAWRRYRAYTTKRRYRAAQIADRHYVLRSIAYEARINAMPLRPRLVSVRVGKPHEVVA